jgi:hypothetical protein
MDDIRTVAFFFLLISPFIVWYFVDAVGRSRSIWRGK